MYKYRIIKETNRLDEVIYYIEKNTSLWRWSTINERGYTFFELTRPSGEFKAISFKNFSDAEDFFKHITKEIKKEIIYL